VERDAGEAICPACGAALIRLGGAVLRVGGATVEIEHFVCPRCGKRRTRHSRAGWNETAVDLNAG
jgi:hypothetical protein